MNDISEDTRIRAITHQAKLTFELHVELARKLAVWQAIHDISPTLTVKQYDVMTDRRRYVQSLRRMQ